MYGFIRTQLKSHEIDEINKYLRGRKLPIFTKKQLNQMDTRKDELDVLGLDIVIRGNYFEFDVNSPYSTPLAIRHRQSDEQVDETAVRYIIALKSSISTFDGLCLNKNKKPIAIMQCSYDDE